MAKKIIMFCILVFIVLTTGISSSTHNYYVKMDGNRANIFNSSGEFMWYVDTPAKSNVFVSSEGVVLRFYDIYGNICEEVRDPEFGYIIKSSLLPFTSGIARCYKLLSVLPFFVLTLLAYFIISGTVRKANFAVISLFLFSSALLIRHFMYGVLPINSIDIAQMIFAGLSPVIVYCFILFVKKVNNFLAYSFVSIPSALICIFSFIFGFFVV